jgi:PPP family 3-phenylpropionic acid transporter
MRIGGSFAFICANLGAGALLTLLHAEAIFWLIAGALSISAIVAFGLPVTPPAVRALDDSVRPPKSSALKLLLKPAFLTLILVGALIQSSHAVLYSFGSLYWQRLGFGGVEIGFFWSIGIACEIALFTWSAPLMRRIGPLGFLALGGLGAIVRWVFFALEPGFVGFALLQSLHGLTFGAVYLGKASATFLAGPLYESLGGHAFFVMAILPGVALAILGVYRLATRR